MSYIISKKELMKYLFILNTLKQGHKRDLSSHHTNQSKNGRWLIAAEHDLISTTSSSSSSYELFVVSIMQEDVYTV